MKLSLALDAATLVAIVVLILVLLRLLFALD